MGRKRSRKKSGRSSTPQTAENPNERRDPRPPPDMTVSGTSPNLVIRKEENTLYFESGDNVVINVGVKVGDVDTVVAGDVQHHYHHHASRSTLEEGARADGDVVDEYQEMEIEGNLEPTAEPRTAGENEASAVEVSTRILQHVQELIASYHNVNKWEENAQLCQELHTLFKQQGNASLHKVRFDSVHFFVRVKLGPDHEAFLQACTDGTLWRGLTKLLVTPELERAAQVKLRLRLKVKETSNKNDSDVPAPAKSSPLPSKHLQEMNTDEVQKWLIEEVHIPISIAAKFAETGVDGELLARYEEQHLLHDFQLPTGVMRKIMYARDDRMKTSVTPQKYESLDWGKASDNESIKAEEEKVLDSMISREDKRDAQLTGAEETPTVEKTKMMQDRELEITADDKSHLKQLSKEEESAGEAKLRYLLTGDEGGSLDSSFHPILVVNKPNFEAYRGDELKHLEEKLGFISLVNWNAVFDCNPKSLKNGVCSMVENKREIKLLLPDIFNKDTSPEELDFNDIPAWIFANGREDLEELQSPSLAFDWNEKYGAGVDRAVDFFATNAIPKERAVIVFLLLSGDNVHIMSDIFKKFQSSLQGRGTFTFIAENQELHEMWAEEVKKWLPQDQLEKRSFIGTEWALVNRYIQKQFGKVAFCPAELPLSEGKTCILPDKKRSQWFNIEVVPSNECENTAMGDGSPGSEEFVAEQELIFYQGNRVSWWNFHLTEGKGRKHRFNQVLRREVSKALNSLVKEKLKPRNPGDVSNAIVTITIFHEPGSGASTTARQVLWDFHRRLRCVIVQRAISPTVEEILEVRQYGYDKSEEVPPVLVLLDDMEDSEVIDLIAQLEIASNDKGGLSFIILHCKRTPDPGLFAKDNAVNSVVIEHKLSDRERRWFTDKFKKYEEEYSMNPEKLIGFMVMKEECNPDYIRRIVSNILREVEGNETQLLKYIAVINKFMEDFGMPVSCCDEFMKAGMRVPSSRGGSRVQYVPWENLLSHAMCLLLIQTRVHTKHGPTKAIKLVNPVLATEVVKQLVEDRDQTVGDVIRELINHSHILESQAYIRTYITAKIRELLVRRRKIANDWSEQSQFSPLIEHLLNENKTLAFQLLEETSEIFKSGVIAQHLARLYQWQGDLVEAARCAKMATDFQGNNPYFWDTRGRVIIDYMKKYKKKYNDTPLDTSEASKLMNLLEDGMNVFKKCQDLQRMEYSQYSNYAGYSGELKVIFLFLHIIEERVVPFSVPSYVGIQKMRVYFLTDEEIPELSPFWKHHRQHLQKLSKRAELTLDSIGDLMTFSKGITRTKQDSEDEMRMRKKEKNDFYEDLLRYFAVDIEQSPPKSVQENPVSMSTWRRAQVKALNADSLYAIFKLAQNGEGDCLKKVRSMLSANDPRDVSDLRLLVCISFALSSFGYEDVDYGTVIRQVQNLNKIDWSLYGAFFAMMLTWPRDDPSTSNINVGMTTRKAIMILREKYNTLLPMKSGKQESQSGYDRSLPRHQTIVRKPLTHFLLAKGEGLKAFVHINVFHASQSTLEEERHKFWTRQEVTEKLVRLEGTIQDRDRIVVQTPSKELIFIRLPLRWHNQPSQEKVSFYLGFSFLGPVAYDVREKDRKSVPVQVKDYRQTYPGYLVGRLSHLQRKEEEIRDTLDRIEYLSKKRRNRQQLTTADRKFMEKKPHLESELRDVQAQIQEEIDKNDNEDETFTLVTKRRRGYKLSTSAVP